MNDEARCEFCGDAIEEADGASWPYCVQGCPTEDEIVRFIDDLERTHGRYGVTSGWRCSCGARFDHGLPHQGPGAICEACRASDDYWAFHVRVARIFEDVIERLLGIRAAEKRRADRLAAISKGESR
jgi:hypothetical protein